MSDLAIASGVNKKMIFLVRVMHGGIVVFFLTCIAYLFYAGITGTINAWSNLAIAALFTEGAVVWLNKGHCPLGVLHRKVGDNKTFLELFFPKPVAKQGIPLCALITLIGLVVYVV
jgi:hypothetical protein